MNIVVLQGRVGRDAEFKADVGSGLATFSLATTESFKDKAGEWKETTDWHNVVVWGKLAEKVASVAKKGSLVCVTGSVKTRSYTDKTGAKRNVTEINAKTVHGLIYPSSDKPVQDADVAVNPAADLDDEIPF